MRNAVYLLVAGIFSLGNVSCSKQEKMSSSPIAPSCLVSQSTCKVITQFGELSVLFNQTEITPESEFSIFVGNATSKKNIKITGYLEGKSMYMGKIPLFFSNKKKLGYQVANTMLGSCSDKQMIWVLQLSITSNPETENSQQEHFSIEFTSIRD